MIITLTPEQAAQESAILKAMGLKHGPIRIIKRSIDARKGQIKIILNAEPADRPLSYETRFNYHDVSGQEPVLIVGSGPAGLFAALRLIELGFKPIVIERGREILPRKQDLALMNRNQAIGPESNYCFGQGGAGTFSDGKLFTRSKKRGDNRAVLEIFHAHGADDAILYEAHPHIGTERLPEIIRRICLTITENGGEIHYNSRVTELLSREGRVRGLLTADGREYDARHIILATGHSAHDIYMMLMHQGLTLETKGFALGLRVEHPQELINRIQYHGLKTNFLPPAAYSLVTQVEGRGVYSFCMCPGGHIVPASTENDGIVVNGMSSATRNSPFANSGIVVETRPEDIPAEYRQYGPLQGLYYRRHIEHLAFVNNGTSTLTAPAARLTDFVNGRLSFDLPECSYLPGIVASPLHFWLPKPIASRLREGFRCFDHMMHGYLTSEAVVVGVESRSSSPVRIPRLDNMQHPDLQGLYPAGEGSGYAGGITSSAIDGRRAAEAIAAANS